MKPRPSITLCLIAKNEAHNVSRLNETILGCFDEVHLTDTGSTDETLSEALKVGWQVSHFEWCDDFAKARNHSIKDVKTDFWMWMDLDDALSDKDAFIRYRDYVLDMHDQHIVPYDYAFDDKGNCAVSFVRERIFRTQLGMHFRDFIHEGVYPFDAKGNQIGGALVTSFRIIHKRTAEEAKGDKGRNLRMLEANKDSLSPRLQFYYGKELCDTERYMDSIFTLKEALKHKDLQPHDRVLGIQYLCWALTKKDEFDEAIKYAIIGTQLKPTRAEFYCILGDCYLKQGRVLDAMPMFNAARVCQNVGSQGFDQTFTVADCYNGYPTLQLAKIHCSMGQFEKARELLLTLMGDKEADMIRLDCEKALAIEKWGDKQIETEDIVISCTPQHPYPWDENVYREKGVGGSETAAIEMAHHLHKLTGRKVLVFNNREEKTVCGGVEYWPVRQVQGWFQQYKPKVNIMWRHAVKLTDAPSYLWCHDLLTPGGENFNNYEKIFALSENHKNYLMAMQNIPESKIIVTRNGIDPLRFRELETVKKNPYKIIWPSSADRGLDRAIAIVDKAREAIPELELHVFYGFDNMIKLGMHDRAKFYQDLIDQRPYIKFHGNVEQNVLARHFMESAVWLYPTIFIETFCITALESLASKCWPLVRNFGALTNTLGEAAEKGMCDLLDCDVNTSEELDVYAGHLIEAIENRKYEKIQIDLESVSWESVAKDWVTMLGL